MFTAWLNWIIVESLLNVVQEAKDQPVSEAMGFQAMVPLPPPKERKNE